MLALTAEKLIWTEWLMVAVFVTGVVAWGVRMRKAARSLEGSFLADRKVPGFIASLSTVATNLNANDFIGGAGFAYGIGLVAAHGQWANGLALLLVSLFVVQKLRRMNVFTLGEWLEKRYCKQVGVAYSITWCMIWMLFNLGLYLYAGALVLETLVGWDLYWSILILSAIAAVYTLIGGFGAVVATDVLQMSLMFFPFVFLAAAVWLDIGSPANLAASLPADKAVYWSNDTPFGPLPLMIFGIFFMGTSYWSCEAQVVQRPLSARSEEDATISYLGATFWLSLLMPMLITVPALAAIHYFPGLEHNDLAMPSLIQKFLPRGLYGVMIVGLLAGVLSSADSQINAFCTMFTTDIYRRLLKPGREEAHYLRASKVAGVIFTVAAIGTALLVSTNKDGMMLFAISVLATIMPPFGALTVVGGLWRRATGFGALTGLVWGVTTALTLVCVSQAGLLNPFMEQTLYFRAGMTFVVTAAVTVFISLRTGPAPASETGGLMDISARLTPRTIRLVAVLLVGIVSIMAFWTYFF